MTGKRPGIVLVVLLALVPAGAAANSEFVASDPDEVPVPEELTKADAAKTLMSAFVMRGWRMTEVSRDQR